jgi:hypothetical protein
MAAAHFFDLINNSTVEIRIAAKNEPQPKDEVFVATEFAPL